MSMLKIAKGGRLMLSEWNPDRRDYDTDTDIDATDRIFFFMDHECELEEGVRIWDIFKLIEDVNAYPVLSPMLTHGPNWLDQIVQEGLYPEKSEFNSVVLKWEGSITNYGDYPELEVWPHFFATKENEDDRWGLSFSPASEYSDCVVKLDTRLILYDERNGYTNPPTVLAEVEKLFTLQEILHGIFYDLSFNGGPNERAERLAEINQASEDIEEGKVECVRFEDVESLMKDLDDDEI